MGTTQIHTPLGRMGPGYTPHKGEWGQGAEIPQTLVLSTCIWEATALVLDRLRAVCGSGAGGGKGGVGGGGFTEEDGLGLCVQ